MRGLLQVGLQASKLLSADVKKIGCWNVRSMIDRETSDCPERRSALIFFQDSQTELCATHQLTITNTRFQLPDKLQMTWMHPRSHRWHHLDHIITRSRDVQDIQLTRVLRSAECWTDHRLLRSTVKVRIVSKRRFTTCVVKQFDTNRLNDPNVVECLENQLKEELRVSGELLGWNRLKVAATEAAKKTVGLKKNKREDWFDSNNVEIQDPLNRKHAAYAKLQQCPWSPKLKNNFQELKRKAQRELRRLRDQWWKDRANHQHLADKNLSVVN